MADARELMILRRRQAVAADAIERLEQPLPDPRAVLAVQVANTSAAPTSAPGMFRTFRYANGAATKDVVPVLFTDGVPTNGTRAIARKIDGLWQAMKGGSTPSTFPCGEPIVVRISVSYCDANRIDCWVEVTKGGVVVASGFTTYDIGSGSRIFTFTTNDPGDYLVTATPASDAVDGPRLSTMMIPECSTTWSHSAGISNANAGLKDSYVCCYLGIVPKTLNCTIGPYQLTLNYQSIRLNASTSNNYWYGMFRTNILNTIWGAAATSPPDCDQSTVPVANNIHVFFSCSSGSGNHRLEMISRSCVRVPPAGTTDFPGIWYDQIPLDLTSKIYYGVAYERSTIPRPATVDITMNIVGGVYPLESVTSPAAGGTARVYA